jgi:beta-mannosidase
LLPPERWWSHCACRPEPFKFIKFPPIKDIGLKITTDYDNETIRLSVKKPVKGVILEVEGETVKWSDQAIDLVPNDPQTITAKGLAGRDVRVRYLGDEMV